MSNTKFVERDIAIAAITSDRFLSRFARIYQKGVLAEFTDVVVRWCVAHWRHYGKAPKKEIQHIFDARTPNMEDRDLVDLIEGFLDSLSEEYEVKAESIDPDHMLDIAAEYFGAQYAAEFGRNLTNAAERGDMKTVDEMISNYRKPEVAKLKCITPMEPGILENAFEKVSKPLFSMGGALGKLMDFHLTPGGFISFMGPEKRGKSWWLMELMVRACRAKIPTVVFQAGDMDEEDFIARLAIRLCGKSFKEKYCEELYVPVLDCVLNQNGKCPKKDSDSPALELPGERMGQKRRGNKKDEDSTETPTPEEIVSCNPDYEPCCECRNQRSFLGATYWTKREACSPLTVAEARRKMGEVLDVWGVEPYIFSYPTSTLTVAEIQDRLEELEYEKGIRPRLVLIDYADILAAPNARQEFRHQQSATWAALRSLALAKNVLVATATQADAASYDAKTLSLRNFSEDKRKYSHVTAMFGLNQTPEEKLYGQMRINVLLARNEEYNFAQQVVCLQCLQSGKPLIKSYFCKKV